LLGILGNIVGQIAHDLQTVGQLLLGQKNPFFVAFVFFVVSVIVFSG